jgi:integrator complex subunit 9
VPEWPFNHAQLVERGMVQVFDNLHGEFLTAYREPCVIFTDHPSLRSGDAVHFMEMWGSKPNNAVIITEPDFGLAEVGFHQQHTPLFSGGLTWA